MRAIGEASPRRVSARAPGEGLRLPELLPERVGVGERVSMAAAEAAAEAEGEGDAVPDGALEAEAAAEAVVFGLAADDCVAAAD